MFCRETKSKYLNIVFDYMPTNLSAFNLESRKEIMGLQKMLSDLSQDDLIGIQLLQEEQKRNL